MSSFKKIFISIKSQIDSIADDFENHEALAEAAINDLQQLATTTRQHEFRIDKMNIRYQTRLNELDKEAGLWSERAIKIKDHDKPKALQCVKRLRFVKQQIEQITKQLGASENQLSDIQEDQNTIQQQILQLKTKKEVLAARQNRNNLQKSLQGVTTTNIDAQSVFDRWEGAVIGDEYESSQEIDSLSSEFERQEDDIELSLMLDELTSESENHSAQIGE